MPRDLFAKDEHAPVDLFAGLNNGATTSAEEVETQQEEYKSGRDHRNRRIRKPSPQPAPDYSEVFYGLPEATVSEIENKISKIKHPNPRGRAGLNNRERKRLANLERLRINNPYLAEEIENMTEGEAFAIGAGHSVHNVGEGFGRLFGLIDAEQAKDPEFNILKGIKGSATLGEVAGNVAMAAAPGSIVAKIPSVLVRSGAMAVLGASEAGLQSSGSGDSAGDIAINSAIGGAVGGLTSGGVPAVKVISKKAKEIAKVLKGESPFKQEIKRLIEAGSEETRVAKYIIDGSGKVAKDKVYDEAVKQGFDEGAAAMIKGASKADKAKMREMVGVLTKRRGSYRWGAENRPADIAGQSILDRYEAIKKVNVSAGKRLGDVAESLKGKEVDFTPAVDSFKASLDDMGVKIGDDLKPSFVGSDIEGIPAAEGAIKRIVGRMSTGGKPKAYDLHRLKKYIDENVSWGKKGDGLTGRTEGELKKLRGDLNQILGDSFPEYRAINEAYSDTIGAIKQLEKVAGSNFDPKSSNAAKYLGTLTRRVESNAQSRIPILDEIANLQMVVEKYGGKSLSKEISVRSGDPLRIVRMRKFDDDAVTQSLFASELDSVFKPAARTSLEGGIGSELRKGHRMARAVKEGPWATAVEGAAMATEKVRGINEDSAIKAIKELLKDSI